MSNNKIILAAALSVAFLPTISSGSDDTNSIRSWAVVPTHELQAAGFSDLLTARLSQIEGIALVERDQLDVVIRELELSTLSGSTAASKRLRLGKLLKADALVLLSLVEHDAKPFLKLVISDCRYGARLRVDHYPYARERLEALVNQCAGAVEKTRQNFAGGIRHVVGVAQILSKNLTHDYDHLQSGYAYLLQNALASRPGVAVIEIEEARAIRQETALLGKGSVDRTVPLLLDGEFIVTRRSSDAEPSVTLTFKVHDAATNQTIRRADLPLSRVASLLSTDLPAQVVRLSDNSGAKPFSEAQQFEWLVARADSFAQVGFWQQATGLREAALLLYPESAKLRLTLMAEYRRIAEQKLRELATEELHPENPRFAAAASRRIGAFFAALPHLEYLIRNQQIEGDEAIELVALHTADEMLSSAFPSYTRTIDGRYWRVGQELLRPAEEAEQRFLTEVYPKVLNLPNSSSSRYKHGKLRFLDKWQTPLLESTFKRIDRTYRTKRDLDHIYHVLTQKLPDGLPTSQDTTDFFENPVRYRIGGFNSPGRRRLPRDAMKETDLIAFFKRLTLSEHRVASACGRFGWIAYRLSNRNRLQTGADWIEQLYTDANQLLQDFTRLDFVASTNSRRDQEWMHRRLTSVCKSLRDELEPDQVAKTPRYTLGPPSKKPPGWETDPELWKVHGYPVTLGKLTFEAQEFQIRRLNGNVENFNLSQRWQFRTSSLPALNFLRCGDQLDVMWIAGAVIVMREKGLFEELLVDAEPGFDEVAWDGHFLWVVTRHAGVWIVDPTTGKVLTKIDRQHGLPPADRGMRLHAVRKGQVFAVGSFGRPYRAWCAMIDYAEGKSTVNVFHHAPLSFLRDGQEETELAFQPEWVCSSTESGRTPRALQVGRARFVSRRRPLQIDLETLDVSVASVEDSLSPDAYYLPNGERLTANWVFVQHWPQTSKSWQDGSSYRRICTNVTNMRLLSGEILEFDGQLYFPGRRWYRIDPRTLQEEMLVPGILPGKYVLDRYAVSAHYGLITWDAFAGKFYRVTIADAAQDHKD